MCRRLGKRVGLLAYRRLGRLLLTLWRRRHADSPIRRYVSPLVCAAVILPFVGKWLQLRGCRWQTPASCPERADGFLLLLALTEGDS
jgi:hypothetical protein